jgi:translation initiation factor 2 subunit 2
LQQTEEGSGTSTPTTAPAATEDLDFSDMKKKKKKSSKKIDLEAFEKELNESKAKDEADDEGDDGEGLAEIDEAELGDDPFAQGADAPTGVDAGNEPWLKTDRDYTYPEVRFLLQLPFKYKSLTINTP